MIHTAAALLIFCAGGAVFSEQTICIDPGHPSEVGRGARGKHLTEIHVAWEVAVRMRDLLRAKGFRVVLTKDREEQMVTNRKRATISNEAHADLLVRLHCDAGNKSGFAVYYPDRQGTAGGVTGPSQQVLNATLPIAQRFYKALTREMNGALTNRGLLSDTKTAIGAKQGALTGSIFSTRPVVLVEMVVLTNPKDEAFIGSAKGLAKMATALANAASASIAPTHTLHK